LQNDILVLTSFLGYAECIDESEEPLLFETMIRGGVHDDIVQQYTTWQSAEGVHKKAVELVSSE